MLLNFIVSCKLRSPLFWGVTGNDALAYRAECLSVCVCSQLFLCWVLDYQDI